MQRSGILSSIAACCALSIAGSPAVVWAQDQPAGAAEQSEGETVDGLTYKQWASQGAQAFADKDYDGAVEAFEQAYSLNPAPNLLYNIGRALEKQGRFEEANDAYTRFVTQPDVELKARQDALQRIETLKKVLSLEESGEEIDAEAVDKEQGQHQLAATDIAEEDAEPQELDEVGAPEAPEEEQYDHTLAYIFGGSGAAVLVGSGVFAYLSHAEMKNAQDATTLSGRREANDAGETYALVADGLLLGGAALAGVGLVLWLTATPESPERSTDEALDEDSTQISLSPQLGADRAGLTFTLDF